jgi:soluble lytic murein transglycosylase
MHWLKILTPLCAASLLTVAAPFAQAQNPGDAVLLDMQKAFRSRNQTALTQLLPQAAGHPSNLGPLTGNSRTAWKPHRPMKSRAF